MTLIEAVLPVKNIPANSGNFSKSGKIVVILRLMKKWIKLTLLNPLTKYTFKSLILLFYCLVPGAGIEPAQPQGPRDFKSYLTIFEKSVIWFLIIKITHFFLDTI